MSFDLAHLHATIAAHGPVVRVVVARVDGSTPREVGAAMLVWPGGQTGTIGGGALEFEAAQQGRHMLETGRSGVLTRISLGPSLGQCCGGAVTVLSEVFDADSLSGLENTSAFARPATGAGDMPLAVTRHLAQARSQGQSITPGLVDGWMLEPVNPAPAPLWIYGAGHVGRALVDVITPLPDFVITWVDTHANRFPKAPAGVTIIPTDRPQNIMRHAPRTAHHLILTYSHALDLELCHAVLSHEFASAGLIGSATKWARFRTRLAALGHGPEQIARITCPIGDKALGKHPQALAIGVAAQLIKQKTRHKNANGEDECDRYIETG